MAMEPLPKPPVSLSLGAGGAGPEGQQCLGLDLRTEARPVCLGCLGGIEWREGEGKGPL